jgi:hypothetical protein
VLEHLVGDREDEGVGGGDHQLAATGGQGEKDARGQQEEEKRGGKNVGPHLFCCLARK